MSVSESQNSKINILREPFKTILANVAERDREWFESHRGEHRYVRQFVPGEIPGLVGAGLADTFVLVHKLTTGIRLRQPLGEIHGPRPFPARINTLQLPDGQQIHDVPVFDTVAGR